MLRRLNAIGREFAIQNELEQLPGNIRDVYKLLLEDCQKARGPKDKAVLKKLFAWLAYSKEPLSLGSAGKLLLFIAKDCEISIDDELEHQCARILRLSNTSADDDQNANSSDDLELVEDDNNTTDERESTTEDLNVFLGFQERSLRHYFRESDDSNDGLQSSGSLGNVLILEVIESILTSTLESNKTTAGQYVVILYAAKYWLSHLTDIDIDELNDAQVASVVEVLWSILSNRNGAIRNMETWELQSPGGIKEFSILGKDSAERDRSLKVLQNWARRAIQLPPSMISPLALTWIKPMIRDSRTVYVKLADAHVSNWLTAPDVRWNGQAGLSFGYAHNSLRLAKDLQSVKGNGKLRGYFDQLDDECTITEESILLVSEAFLHIDKTAQSYRAIGMAMENEGMHEEALKQYRIGLDISVSDSDQLHLYYEMGDIILRVAEDAVMEESTKKTDAVNETTDGAVHDGEDTRKSHGTESSVSKFQGSDEALTNGVHKDQDGSQDVSDETKLDEVENPPVLKKTQKQWANEASEILSVATNLTIPLSEDPEEQSEVRHSLMNVWYSKQTSSPYYQRRNSFC